VTRFCAFVENPLPVKVPVLTVPSIFRFRLGCLSRGASRFRPHRFPDLFFTWIRFIQSASIVLSAGHPVRVFSTTAVQTDPEANPDSSSRMGSLRKTGARRLGIPVPAVHRQRPSRHPDPAAPFYAGRSGLWGFPHPHRAARKHGSLSLREDRGPSEFSGSPSPAGRPKIPTSRGQGLGNG
jgi:hypothetical protein